MRILRSALKHGCATRDVGAALETSARRTLLGEDPVRWLYVGFDGVGRVLEIVTVVGDDGQEVVIHAMRARRQYLPGRSRS
ncbi:MULTISPECIES: hypothetical protein [unclassified Actinomyces]|uniref:hypothetical protein n=1 Tax=unclassified Actinomyces TaxID=2609248 RepID=UPI0020183189|nr:MULTISPECIES: hypothetical protein [unclassified Actinomyces]MCL3778616.1 hypothetical protein [Actinomyces sp. AC-20-1]MCL3789938.1 hypothetical protein [Actinomyces sp. 187325]MCL3792154.1 hypothetical protein [Actinomyces sp. 186855]MCL3794888.1 hypothetical protein [Actinomyces sp. 217892]